MGRPSLLNLPVGVSVCLSVCVYVCDWAGFGSLESGMGVADKKIVLWRITNSNT